MDDRISQIEEVIDNFNFERVHIAMTALDWKWAPQEGETDKSVPSIPRLKSAARQLLINAINHKHVGSGGFEAKYYPKVDDEPEYFSLAFVLCSTNSYDD